MASRHTGEGARNGVAAGLVVVERTPRDGEGRGRARPWRRTPDASFASAGVQQLLSSPWDKGGDVIVSTGSRIGREVATSSGSFSREEMMKDVVGVHGGEQGRDVDNFGQ